MEKFKVGDVVILKCLLEDKEKYNSFINEIGTIVRKESGESCSSYDYIVHFFKKLDQSYSVNIKNKRIDNCLDVFEGEIKLYKPVLKKFIEEMESLKN